MTEMIASTFNVGDDVVIINHRDSWCVYETGVYKGRQAVSENLVCSPLWRAGNVVNMAAGTIKVCIKGVNSVTGELFEVVVDGACLHPGQHNPIFKELMNRGVHIQQGENNRVLDYLSSCKAPLVYGVDKVGWHHHHGRQMFVTPMQVYGADSDKTYRYAPDGFPPSQGAIGLSGTLETWQHEVVGPCVGNPLALFALGAAFAAPLMALFHVDGGGFHFYGHSSRGKTTLLQVGSSVWGNASDPAQDPGHSFLQRWNITINAIEVMALAYNDLLLPMDELGTSNIKNFGQAIYQLAGGKGKAAMNSNRDLRPTRTWRTLILSSGEHAISKEVEATTGAEARAGQLIRFIDISVEGDIFPAFAVDEAGQKVTALKLACSRNYGVAGHLYLQHLVKLANAPELMRPWLDRFGYVEEALAASAQNLQPEQRRALKRFALVAIGMMLANEAGVIRMEDRDIIEAVIHAQGMWLAEMPTVSEAERGVEQLKQFLLSNPGRFGSADAEVTVGSNLVGYKDVGRKRYIIFKNKMEEVCGRPNVMPVIKRLKELGHLNHNEGRLDLKWRGTYVYAIWFNIAQEETGQET